MNIKKIFILVIFMTTLITNAQIKLTGVVKDSIGPLEMANVIALDTISKIKPGKPQYLSGPALTGI